MSAWTVRPPKRTLEDQQLGAVTLDGARATVEVEHGFGRGDRVVSFAGPVTLLHEAGTCPVADLTVDGRSLLATIVLDPAPGQRRGPLTVRPHAVERDGHGCFFVAWEVANDSAEPAPTVSVALDSWPRWLPYRRRREARRGDHEWEIPAGATVVRSIGTIDGFGSDVNALRLGCASASARAQVDSASSSRFRIVDFSARLPAGGAAGH